MSSVAAERGRLRGGTELATAALIAAERAPLAVRAYTSQIVALTQGITGNEYAMRAANDEARALMDSPDFSATRPEWLYFFDGADFDRLSGVCAARLSFASSRNPARLLDEAGERYGRTIFAGEAPSPRDTLWHTAWFARAQLRAKDVGGALGTARPGVTTLRTVRAPRVTRQFRNLDRDLAGIQQSREVTRFRDELRHNLAA